MTRKLFLEDAYQTSCTATVTAIDGTRVQVDQTIFFAFAGGQASDKGTINGIAVVDAQDGEHITYTLTQDPPFRAGDTVTITIDERHRDMIRRLHSATHIVCHYWEQQSGTHDYIGSNVSADKGRIDFLFNEPVSPRLPALESAVNTFVAQHHPVSVENQNGTLHWKSDNIHMHCCGTHVRNTSEIGPVKLKRKNIGAGKERIEILLASP